MLLVLDSIGKSIEAKISGAPATTDPDFVATWADHASSGGFVEGSTQGALNGATVVTIVPAPAASTRRVIQLLNIYNRDTAPITLTVQYNDGATRIIASVTLDIGDVWKLDGTLTITGAQKTPTAFGVGTVSTVSVVSANGLAGTVATPTSTPAITLSTSITGVLKGNGTAISAATAGTDYTTPSSTETVTNKSISFTTNTVTMTSAQLATAISDETGSGKAVFEISPSMKNVTLQAGTTTLAPIVLTAGTNLTTPVAGAIEFDGTDFTFSV